MIPKKHKPGQWKLILDLSSLDKYSVNDGIVKELASLSYVSVDDVTAIVTKLGKGAALAKLDIKQVYRHVPVSPLDRQYLGMQWGGNVYIDTVCITIRPMVCPPVVHSTCRCSTLAAQQQRVEYVFHYIDDFISVGRPDSLEWATNLQESAIPWACQLRPKKTEGPATCITFLGIEIDSTAMEICLPVNKIALLKDDLARSRGKKSIRKRDILSLIGSLSHACKVVRSGRAFLHRLIALSSGVKKLDHFVRLNSCAKADIEWWYVFGTSWNGISILHSVNKANPAFSLTTDASGSWGCGGFSGSLWFSLPWNLIGASLHITVQELIPITLAAALWGK